jgi:hypothetical protein
VSETRGEPLPDEITLSRDEAQVVLFALDAAAAALPEVAREQSQLRAAARIIEEKFLPDLPYL